VPRGKTVKVISIWVLNRETQNEDLTVHSRDTPEKYIEVRSGENSPRTLDKSMVRPE